MINVTSKTMATPSDRPNDGYFDFLECIKESFKNEAYGEKLFTTNTSNLFDEFIKELPIDARQHYTCNCCRRFIDKFGCLVTIDKNGNTKSVMWNTTFPKFFRKSTNNLKHIVESANVTGVFISSEKIWGDQITGIWQHMSVSPEKEMLFTSRIKTADQRIAELREDYKTLSRAMVEFDEHCIDVAINVLETDKLFNGEKFLGVAKWLKKIHVDTKKNHQKNNILWRYVASAPKGWCHPRSTMIGTLLEDIVNNYSLDEIKRRFNAKMKPTQYMRPQVAPSVGNLWQANKIVSKLDAEGSLERRYARFDDPIVFAWKPSTTKSHDLGVFSGITPKEKTTAHRYAVEKDIRRLSTKTVDITWTEFERTVLPRAKKIEFSVIGTDNFCALVTAKHDNAPPIIQWDQEDLRNPFSWYVYNGGSVPKNWNLKHGWNTVTGITFKPCMWYGTYSNHSKGVIFILDGARDSNWNNPKTGCGLFPSILKSEFHEVRASIEAYSNSHKVSGYNESSACGLLLDDANKSWGSRHMFRVNEKDTYILTNWG